MTTKTTHRKCCSWLVSSPKSDSSATVPIFCPPLRMLLNTIKRSGIEPASIGLERRRGDRRQAPHRGGSWQTVFRQPSRGRRP